MNSTHSLMSKQRSELTTSEKEYNQQKSECIFKPKLTVL